MFFISGVVWVTRTLGMDFASKLQGEYKGRQAKQYKPTSDGTKLSSGGGCPTLGGNGCSTGCSIGRSIGRSIGCTGGKSGSCRCSAADCIAGRRCFVSCQLSQRISNLAKHTHLPHCWVIRCNRYCQQCQGLHRSIGYRSRWLQRR
jgi:hypothetical protein